MFESVDCIIEIVILVLAIGLLSGDRGMFDSNPKYMSSNPGVGAAIGNAANRHFENSQCNLGGCMTNKAEFRPMPSGPSIGFPQVTKGFATNPIMAPENLVNY